MSSPIAAVAPAASATASETAQLAALTKLQATYAADIKAGQTTAELQSLGQQITAAAAALGKASACRRQRRRRRRLPPPARPKTSCRLATRNAVSVPPLAGRILTAETVKRRPAFGVAGPAGTAAEQLIWRKNNVAIVSLAVYHSFIHIARRIVAGTGAIMPSQISAVSSASSAAAAALASQRAALVKMTATYTSEIGNPQSAAQLQSLAQQIAEAATALGQSVSLPQVPGAAAPVVSAVAAGGGEVLPSGYA